MGISDSITSYTSLVVTFVGRMKRDRAEWHAEFNSRPTPLSLRSTTASCAATDASPANRWRGQKSADASESAETQPECKSPLLAGISATSGGLFSEPRTAWLTSEDSNSHIPVLEKPFEMSGKFPHFSREFEVGDFRLPPRPRIVDRILSLSRTSSKREYFRKQGGLSGIYRHPEDAQNVAARPAVKVYEYGANLRKDCSDLARGPYHKT